MAKLEEDCLLYFDELEGGTRDWVLSRVNLIKEIPTICRGGELDPVWDRDKRAKRGAVNLGGVTKYVIYHHPFSWEIVVEPKCSYLAHDTLDWPFCKNISKYSSPLPGESGDGWSCASCTYAEHIYRTESGWRDIQYSLKTIESAIQRLKLK